MELIGWFVTEGSSDIHERREYESATRGVSHTLQIAQKDSRGREKIRKLLDRMNIPYSTSNNGFTFCSELWYDILVDGCGECSEEKRLPEWVFDCSTSQIELLFETLVDGDGNKQRNRYTTKSTILRDQFMRLAVMVGRNPRYHKYENVWRIRFGETENCLPKSDTSSIEDGVYCVTVEDNHTMLAGRNGKFQWVGQSLYGASSFTNFPFYDWRVGEATTLAGRLLLTFGRERIVESLERQFSVEDIEVVVGDTDGFGVSIDSDLSREQLVAHAEQAVEEFNKTHLPPFVEETFGVSGDETEHELELESYARRLFVPDDGSGDGTKKTYAQHITMEDGEDCDDLVIKGFEAKRSDTSDVTTAVQSDVLQTILSEPPAEARETVYKRIRTAVDTIRQGRCHCALSGNVVASRSRQKSTAPRTGGPSPSTAAHCTPSNTSTASRRSRSR